VRYGHAGAWPDPAVPGPLGNRLAAVDKTSGQLLPWNATALPINSMLAQNGQVYVGGSFTMVGNQVRNHLAVFDAPTGQLLGN
jgi:hypothetical protein